MTSDETRKGKKLLFVRRDGFDSRQPTKSGRVYIGCNIKNSAFTPTVCAERTAFFKAISEGESDFEMIAVAGGKDSSLQESLSPCGVCRQVMSEFCSADFKILVVTGEQDYKEFTLAQLLPQAFNINKE